MSTTNLTPRNPQDFKKTTEATRPDWNHDLPFTWTKTRQPDWTLGQGASNKNNPSKTTSISIDPYAPDRPPAHNYRLITSAVIPRPTALVSTISADGTSTNLAPYSFFQAMSHDPPTFVVGHARAADGSPKNSLKNLLETKECVINVLTEDVLEAANACATDAPYGVSEWALSGLTPAACENVKASRIQEAVFGVECKLVSTYDVPSRSRPGAVATTITILEGVKFWVREDVVDADRKMIDPALSRPIGRLQGISYGRIMEAFQIPWPSWEAERADAERNGIVKAKAEEQ